MPTKKDDVRSSIEDKLLFRGRPGDTRLGEWVIPVSTMSEPAIAASGRQAHILWGCPDDTGVVRNRGREGAKSGPDSIRRHFFKMTPPMDFNWEEKISLFDYGNLIPSATISHTHQKCERAAEEIAATGATILCLGGGHDFAAPNFLGFMAGYRRSSSVRSFGLINVDPHLDVRELEGGLPHSGTPFRVILESGKLKGKSLVQWGTHSNRNSRDHFRYCQKKKVRVLPFEKLRGAQQPVEERFNAELRRLTRAHSAVGVTFDMDACCDTEGVSAPPVLGFSSWELRQMAAFAGSSPKVKYFEIAEVAPQLEPTERSSRIAAEMLFAFLQARARSLGRRK